MKTQLSITDLYNSKIQMGPIDMFKPNTWNINEQDDETFNKLKSSIQTTNGKYLKENPIKVREDGETDKLEIVDGEHRWKACKELGIKRIPFEKIEIDTVKAKKLNVIYTRHRGDEDYYKLSKLLNEEYWKDMEEAENHNWNARNKPYLTKIDQDTLAKGFGMSESEVNDIIKIYQKLKNLFDPSRHDEMNFSNRSLVMLARCRSPFLREKLINKTIENKWNSTTIRTKASKFNKVSDHIKELIDNEEDQQLLLEELSDETLFDFEFSAIKNKIDGLADEILKKKIIHGDAFEEIPKLEQEVDHIITDPPYNLSETGVGAIFENRKDISRVFGEWDIYEKHEFLKFLRVFIEEAAEKLKEGGSFLLFTSDHYISYVRDIMEKCGLKCRSTLYWHKTNPTNSVGKNKDVSSVELIAYATKGDKRTFNWLGQNRMHNHTETSICMGNERTTHPTQKPLEVITWLLEKYTNSGDLVLDPFAGSGTTGIACKQNNRNFILIEREEKYIDLIDMRFKQLEGES